MDIMDRWTYGWIDGQADGRTHKELLFAIHRIATLANFCGPSQLTHDGGKKDFFIPSLMFYQNGTNNAVCQFD